MLRNITFSIFLYKKIYIKKTSLKKGMFCVYECSSNKLKRYMEICNKSNFYSDSVILLIKLNSTNPKYR